MQQVIFHLARPFLNGNVAKLEAALLEARKLKISLEDFDRVRRVYPEAIDDEAIDEFYKDWLLLAENVEDRLGNLLTLIFGFSHLREQMNEVREWYGDDENVKRLRQDDK